MNRDQQIKDIVNTFSVSPEDKDRIARKCIATYSIGKMISGDSKPESELWEHFRSTVLDQFTINDKEGRAPEDSGAAASEKMKEKILNNIEKITNRAENSVKFYKI